MLKKTLNLIAFMALAAAATTAKSAILTTEAAKASCWKGDSTIVISDYKATVNGRKVGPGQIRPALGKTLLTYSTPRSSMYLEVRHGDLKSRESSALCRTKKNCIAHTEKASAGNDQIYQCLFFK